MYPLRFVCVIVARGRQSRCGLTRCSTAVDATGDDNLALISHGPSTMSNLTLANLTLSSTSAAIKLSVYEAAASGSVTGVRVSNVSITDTNRGICLDPRWGAGGRWAPPPICM